MAVAFGMKPGTRFSVWETDTSLPSRRAVELIRREILRQDASATNNTVNAVLIDFFLYDLAKEREAAGKSSHFPASRRLMLAPLAARLQKRPKVTNSFRPGKPLFWVDSSIRDSRAKQHPTRVEIGGRMVTALANDFVKRRSTLPPSPPYEVHLVLRSRPAAWASHRYAAK